MSKSSFGKTTATPQRPPKKESPSVIAPPTRIPDLDYKWPSFDPYRSLEDPFSEVVNKIIGWLKNRNCPSHLPRTKEKLRKSIQKMCSLACCCSDEQIDQIISIMVEQNLFSVSTAERNIHYNINVINERKSKAMNYNSEDLKKQLVSVSSKGANKKDHFPFDVFVDRCQDWLLKTDTRPSTYEKLVKSLRFVCVYHVQVPVDDVVSHLEEKNIFTIVPASSSSSSSSFSQPSEDLITYHLE
eukprot:TRINITY_DN6174_c0_g1_i1.p1 TRINITY_DN6174_c0_g1~~TRINITY_DN6174_c0_g1_i1.p1  ORF type:complete len:242 (-),score=63.12 TRINITY_DN6174_c0_g1_i1:21-746(-)